MADLGASSPTLPTRIRRLCLLQKSGVLLLLIVGIPMVLIAEIATFSNHYIGRHHTLRIVWSCVPPFILAICILIAWLDYHCAPNVDQEDEQRRQQDYGQSDPPPVATSRQESQAAFPMSESNDPTSPGPHHSSQEPSGSRNKESPVSTPRREFGTSEASPVYPTPWQVITNSPGQENPAIELSSNSEQPLMLPLPLESSPSFGQESVADSVEAPRRFGNSPVNDDGDANLVQQRTSPAAATLARNPQDGGAGVGSSRGPSIGGLNEQA